MVKLEWSEIANNDLFQIYNYIYYDSVYYAVKTINAIGEITENLKVSPYMGRKIPEFNEYTKRELIYKRYRIMYKIESNNILIYRIWHSARRMPIDLIF